MIDLTYDELATELGLKLCACVIDDTTSGHVQGWVDWILGDVHWMNRQVRKGGGDIPTPPPPRSGGDPRIPPRTVGALRTAHFAARVVCAAARGRIGLQIES